MSGSSGTQVAVIGEALVDIIIDRHGEVAASVVGGAPLNTARTLARLGVPTSFVGGISADPLGQRILRLLDADGVRHGLPRSVEAPTTLAIAQLDEAGAATYRFLMEGTSACAVAPAEALAAVGPATRVVHAGTLGLVLEPLADATRAVVAASPADRIVMVDPNCRPSVMASSAVFDRTLAAVLERADVVKVSGDDLAFMAPGEPALEAARALHRRTGASVLLTDGARAVHVIAADGERTLEVPAVPVVDTVGAGDSFSGGVLAWWLERDLPRADLARADLLAEAAAHGIAVAGITCQRAGADPPRAAELG